ncbi:MAG: phosphoribosylaminoimidazolesuccinocarboxamide synthase, partial [Flavobacteriales bacterium]
DQKQLSKEFVREWLIENGFQGLEGQSIPAIPDEFVKTVTERYTELYEKITGEIFVKADVTNIEQRIENNVNQYLR